MFARNFLKRFYFGVVRISAETGLKPVQQRPMLVTSYCGDDIRFVQTESCSISPTNRLG